MTNQPPPQQRDLSELPKAELHLHLEGAMRRSTLVELCHKYKVPVPLDTAAQRFDDFSAFVNVYVAACNVLREASDIQRLVLEVAQDAQSYGAVWLEVAPSFTFYADRFVGGKQKTLQVLAEAAARAETETGVKMGFVVSVERQLGVAEAEELANLVREVHPDLTIHGRPAIVGFGLHGPEEGHPPGPFQKAFEIACGDSCRTGKDNQSTNATSAMNAASKIASLPHAGEIAPSPGTGAQSVMDTVCLLKAKRIAHGVLAANTEDVLQALISRDVCLDVCVTSNYLLNVVETQECHPLPRLIERGVPCTINSDDPLLFGCTLLSEFELCRTRLHMSDEVLAACAKNSFRYSCAPDELKRKHKAAVDQWLSGDSNEGTERT